MHPNPAFRYVPQDRNLRFAASRGFGMLAISGEGGMPLLSHIPFILEGDQALFHLVRSNPIVRQLRSAVPAKLAISGPDSYISPDWYQVDHQVPTWNYVAVHLSGTAELLPQERLREVLDKLSDKFEEQLAPKPIWKTDKMPDDLLDRMMRQIVPCVLTISDVQGTWKLAQNKPEAARLVAAEAVAMQGIGAELAALADLMRDPPAQD